MTDPFRVFNLGGKLITFSPVEHLYASSIVRVRLDGTVVGELEKRFTERNARWRGRFPFSPEPVCGETLEKAKQRVVDALRLSRRR